MSIASTDDVDKFRRALNEKIEHLKQDIEHKEYQVIWYLTPLSSPGEEVPALPKMTQDYLDAAQRSINQMKQELLAITPPPGLIEMIGWPLYMQYKSAHPSIDGNTVVRESLQDYPGNQDVNRKLPTGLTVKVGDELPASIGGTTESALLETWAESKHGKYFSIAYLPRHNVIVVKYLGTDQYWRF